ncbi:MAG TPA: hypothetical protein VJL39_03140 [Candidatus Paceibacterota bacterium]
MVTKSTKITLAGAAGAAVAAAGYYFYASKNASKHRKVAARWAIGFKKEAQKHVKKLDTVDSAAIARAVDKAAIAYGSLRTIDKKALAAAARELKTNWREFASEASKAGRRVVRTTSKRVGKSARSRRG